MEAVVLGMTDWLAFGEGLMGGRIGKGVRAERGGVKIPGSSGENGFGKFLSNISDSISELVL